MLEGISWSQYATVIATGLILYYLYVFMRFKGNKGEHLPEKTAKYTPIEYSNENPAFAEPEWEADAPEISDEMFDRAAELIAGLRGFIENTEISSLTREELTGQLRGIINAYPELNQPAFRAGINDHILQAMKEKGSVVLSEHEAEGLW